MEDLLPIYNCLEKLEIELEKIQNEALLKFRTVLYGPQVVSAAGAASGSGRPQDLAAVAASPQQTKKRPKRLSSLLEGDESQNKRSEKIRYANGMDIVEHIEEDLEIVPLSDRLKEAQRSQSEAAGATLMEKDSSEAHQPELSTAKENVMPPPPQPPAADTHEFVRPQRAAKLKSEKNLKEATLRSKLRRPSNNESTLEARVKKENEQRASQLLHNGSTVLMTRSKLSTASVKSTDSSLLVLPEKAPPVVDLLSDNGEQDEETPVTTTAAAETSSQSRQSVERQLRVKIKREKFSLTPTDAENVAAQLPTVENNNNKAKATQKVPTPKLIVIKTESTDANDATSTNNSETIINTDATTSTTISTKSKSKKKKKEVHVPIKVESFSELDVKEMPVSSRTRSGSAGRPIQRQASVYEDAIDQSTIATTTTTTTEVTAMEPTTATAEPKAKKALSKFADETVSGSAASIAANQTIPNNVTVQPNATMILGAADATFQMPNAAQTTFVVENPNATITIASKECVDVTFNVASQPTSSSPLRDDQSMVTAKEDISQTAGGAGATEDESYVSTQQQPTAAAALLPPPPPVKTKSAGLKAPTSAKAFKMPTRTNELFNPLIQSPLKKKVEAFEAAAAVQQTKQSRPKRTKENALPTPSQNATPNIVSKLGASQTLGRFLTPTQSSNITPNASIMANSKKLASSASKAVPFLKTVNSASMLKGTTTSSSSSGSGSTAKTAISRENSAEDFRRGLHLIAEERKKQREQKHLLAAQLREAKDKERAERVAKMAKEREEKRQRKKADQMEEQKRALEEIQRKLKQKEEQEKQMQAAAAKERAAQEQERELLQQMRPPKAKQNLMPAPRMRTKYTFEMLHEDDSTDDENKVTYKRPPPPNWSRKSARGPAILMQQYWPTDLIDSFFSVQAMSPDLKLIFPNIDERRLKRNSSAFWNTPPRYSDLPKY